MREKIYPTAEELRKLGFEQKGDGDDPRDFWHEVDLGSGICLNLDAYFDFEICLMDGDSVPLNFQSIEEIDTFIKVFKRPYNGAFSGLIDICKSEE